MKKVHPFGLLVLLLIFTGLLFYDLRKGSDGVVVDSVLVLSFAVILPTKLIDARSELEEQRLLSQQQNHR